MLAVPQTEAEVGRREHPVHPLQHLGRSLEGSLLCCWQLTTRDLKDDASVHLIVLRLLEVQDPLGLPQVDQYEVLLVLKGCVHLPEAESQLCADIEIWKKLCDCPLIQLFTEQVVSPPEEEKPLKDTNGQILPHPFWTFIWQLAIVQNLKKYYLILFSSS